MRRGPSACMLRQDSVDAPSSSALSRSASLHAEPLAAGVPAVERASQPSLVTRRTCGGSEWLCLGPGQRVLSEAPPESWARPAESGWELIKHNARREVWRAALGGRVYYVKYYFARPWRDALNALVGRSAHRAEWASGLYAARARLPAVSAIACTPRLQRMEASGQPGRWCAVLVTEGIEPVRPLSDYWLELMTDEDVERRRRDVHQLIERLAELIARAHQSGFEHRDMHAANILVQTVAPGRYQTLFVDLQSARRGRYVDDGAVVRNLAQLNQWFRKHSTTGDRLRFLRAYLRWRDELEPACDFGRRLGLDFGRLVRALARAARDHAGRLGVRRDHRTGRDGRYFARVRLGDGWRGAAMRTCKHPSSHSAASQLTLSREWWCSHFARPLQWFDPSVGESCKNSHSAQVRRAVLDLPEAGHLPVIIKRPLARNWHRRLVQLLTVSRSRRAWSRGYALLNRDVPTARPLAVFERRWGPFVLDSLLVTEALPGALDLEQFLRRARAERTPAQWHALKRALLPLLVAHLRRLHERGFAHRDCKAGNILVVEHPALKLLWIDLDGIRFVGRPTQHQQWRALVRLHLSLAEVPGLTRTDRVRFLRAYLARFGVPRDAWRRAWPALSGAASAKQRTLAARRAWKLKHYGRI